MKLKPLEQSLDARYSMWLGSKKEPSPDRQAGMVSISLVESFNQRLENNPKTMLG